MNKRIKYTCSMCGGKHSEKTWKQHIISKKHLENIKIRQQTCYLQKEIYDIMCKENIGGLFGMIPKVKLSKGD